MEQQILFRVVEELSLSLTGGRIDRIYQDERGDILLSVSRAGKKHTLLLSPDSMTPHLYRSSRKHSARTSPASFVLFMRSHLLRANLVSIGLLNEDRIVDIRFRKHGKELSILFELFRPQTNIIAADEHHHILASFRPFPAGAMNRRQLALGSPYTPPQRKEGGTPTIAIDKENTVKKGRSANLIAEELYERAFLEHEETALRQDLVRTLKKAVVRARRKEEAIAADLASAERAEEYRSAGELILKNVRSIRKGERSVLLRGYDDTGATVELDPTLSPSGNAERYFKKYKKAKAGKAIIVKRLGLVRRETARLNALAEEVKAVADRNALRALRADILQAGFALKGSRSTRAVARTALPSGHRVFQCGEWNILVGKNARGNDALTRTIARPDDLWLHAEGMPGSHVLIRNPRKAEVPPDVLLKAAALAAYYSSGRGAEKVSVVYTQAKYVKKPKGAPPGQVSLSRGNSLMAKPSQSI